MLNHVSARPLDPVLPVRTRSSRTAQSLPLVQDAPHPNLSAPQTDALKNMVLFGSRKLQKLTYQHQKTITDPVLGKIEVYKFSNGMTFYGLQRDDVPLVSYGELIKSGSANETKRTNGASHFLEHLIFKGTKNLTGDAAQEAFADLGASINAFTSLNETFYYAYHMPKESLPQAIDLWAELLSEPAIPQTELDRERFAVIEEINKSNQSPGDKMFTKLKESVWPDSRAKWETLGPKRIIQNISRDEILKFVHHYYDPANRALIAVGDFDLKPTLDAIAKSHERPFAGKKSFRPQKPLAVNAVKKETVLKKDVELSQLLMAFRGPDPKTSGYEKQVAALELLATILGGSGSSRLHRGLVEEKQLAMEIGMGVYTTPNESMAYIGAASRPEHLKAIQAETRQALKEIADRGVTPEELKKAVTRQKQEMANAVESQSNLMGDLALAISHDRLENGYGNRIRTQFDKLTPADIREAARRFLKPDAERTVMLVPRKAKAKSGKSRFAGALGPKEQSTRLPGGTEVLLREKPGALNTAVTVLIRGGNRLDNIPGASTVLADMLQRGTKTMSAVQLAEKLDELGISFGTEAFGDSLLLSFKSLSENKTAMLELIREILRNPGFRQEDLNFVRKHLRDDYQGMVDNSPAVLLKGLLHKELYASGHPYAATGRGEGFMPEALMSRLDEMSVDSLKALYQTIFRPGNMTISGVGDLSVEELKEAAGALVSDLPEGNVALPPAPVQELVESRMVTVSREGLSQAEIMRGWFAPSVKSEDRVPLMVLNTLLGGGMNSRLFMTFREKAEKALCYTVNTRYVPREGGGEFKFYIGTDPANINLVLDMFQREIGKLMREAPDAKELRRIKMEMKSSLVAAGQSTLNMSETLASHRAMGTDSLAELVAKIDQVTPEQVRAMAEKYLGKPSTTVVMAPKAALESSGLPVDGSKKLND